MCEEPRGLESVQWSVFEGLLRQVHGCVPLKKLLGAMWQTLRVRGAARGAGQCLEEGSWAGQREVRVLGRPAAWTSASGQMENVGRACQGNRIQLHL